MQLKNYSECTFVFTTATMLHTKKVHNSFKCYIVISTPFNKNTNITKNYTNYTTTLVTWQVMVKVI